MRIASSVDETIPSGANWHQELLNQMDIEIPSIRPAVISSNLKEALEEYLGFRHVVRNIYTYHFNPGKIEALIVKLPSVFYKAEAELTAFAKFLQNVPKTRQTIKPDK